MRRRRKRGGWPALVAVVAALSAPSPAAASERDHAGAERARTIPIPASLAGPPGRSLASSAPHAQTAALGTVQNWLALDERLRRWYPKQYTLRAVTPGVEVWVASDLSFPDGDCRNTVEGGSRIVVGQAEAAYIARQFDDVILPRMSAAFSVPPPRDGSGARADPATFAPAGDGARIVVLVDNVRDANWYDRDNASNLPYVAGFFAPSATDFFDRNVLTLDAWDWAHRTGAAPAHEPMPGDLCRSAPARPYLYESVLAHEYQHLLMSHLDDDEALWVDEGLADWAQTLTGYVDPRQTIYQAGGDRHVQCFLGWLGVRTSFNPNPRPGGPENSLTMWGDAGQENLLCDYGAAYTFMELLAGRLGPGFMAALHREPADGLDGLRAVLAATAPGLSARTLIEDWAVAVAVDARLDRGAPLLGGRARSALEVPTLHAGINWGSPLTHRHPGAPPNGSDYVRPRARGRVLRAADVRSVSFSAARPAAFSLQLVAYAGRGSRPAFVARVPLQDGSGSAPPSLLRRLRATGADVVAAVVTYHDPDEQAEDYGRYRLRVNGAAQAGG